MSVIFENENYRVLQFNPNPASKLKVVFFEHWRAHFSSRDPSDFEHIDDVNFLTQRNINCYFVQTRRNDWYQSPGLLEAGEKIKSIKGADDKYIAFGNSMGGFAAIAYARDFDADYFIATSPQASFSPDFIDASGEDRWQDAWPVFVDDRIRNGHSISIPGCIMVDMQLKIDAIHAEEISGNTQASILVYPGTWHHSGKIVQRVHGLLRFLTDAGDLLVRGEPVSELIGEIQGKIDNTPETKFFYETPNERISALCSLGPQYYAGRADPHALSALFEREPCAGNAIVISLIFGCGPADHKQWIAARFSFGRHLAKHGFEALSPIS